MERRINKFIEEKNFKELKDEIKNINEIDPWSFCYYLDDEDGIDLMGYLAWSPIDFLSSHKEIRKRYGFVYVNRDFKDLLDLKRYKKKSFYWYQKVIQTNGQDLENDIEY